MPPHAQIVKRRYARVIPVRHTNDIEEGARRLSWLCSLAKRQNISSLVALFYFEHSSVSEEEFFLFVRRVRAELSRGELHGIRVTYRLCPPALARLERARSVRR